MGIDEILKDKREQINEIAKKHGAYNVRVFGSVARGDARPDSDVDFLVELESGRSLLDHVHLVDDLAALLQKKVDLVEQDGLHWYIRDQVLKEAKPL